MRPGRSESQTHSVHGSSLALPLHLILLVACMATLDLASATDVSGMKRWHHYDRINALLVENEVINHDLRGAKYDVKGVSNHLRIVYPGAGGDYTSIFQAFKGQDYSGLTTINDKDTSSAAVTACEAAAVTAMMAGAEAAGLDLVWSSVRLGQTANKHKYCRFKLRQVDPTGTASAFSMSVTRYKMTYTECLADPDCAFEVQNMDVLFTKYSHMDSGTLCHDFYAERAKGEKQPFYAVGTDCASADPFWGRQLGKPHIRDNKEQDNSLGSDDFVYKFG